jgi:signal peptidase II
MLAVSVLTGLALLAGVVFLLSGRLHGALPLVGATLVLSGGISNLLERVMYGVVVDYFQFLFVDFAIFNIADVMITCGVLLLFIYIVRLGKKGGEPHDRISD